MGHGDRWAAVLQNRDRDLPTYIQRITQESTAVASSMRRFVWPAEDDLPEVALDTAPVGLFFLEASVSYCAILVMARDQQSTEIATFYPTPIEGITHNLTIQKVTEDCCGLEGWVDATTKGGIPISFFASDYFVHPERYREGASVQVALSGILYDARAAVPREFNVPVTNPDVLRIFRERGMDIQLGESVRHSTGRAAIMLPIEGWEPFEYKFQGPVKEVKRSTHGARDFYNVVATVARNGDEDVDIRFVVTPHVLNDYEPAAGSMMNAAGCIMGHLADFRWQESARE